MPGLLVVDANIVLSALIRDGATREIILDRGMDLRSPPWLWEEIAGRYEWLQNKSCLSAPALDELLRQIRARITDIPAALIEEQREKALARVGKSGRKDAPYVAAVLAVRGTLWTHDKKLRSEARIATTTTADLLGQASSSKS
jgi:predicted nucleic acid-binding protein